MAVSSNSIAASLEALIDTQLADIQEASVLSASIKQMLIDLDASSLQAVFAKQSDVLERLRCSSNQINVLLERAGIEANYNGIVSFINTESSLSLSQKSSLSKKLDELKKWTVQGQIENHVNQRLMQQGHQIAQRALNELLGFDASQSARNNTNSYDESGHTSNNQAPKTFASV